jgi:hypothetical protein
MPVSIIKIWFDEERIFVLLSNENLVSVPISTYTRLKNATEKQRNNFELWNDGKWAHWEEIDEDLSAEGFLNYQKQHV